MTVFIGGPREITELNFDIEDRLDNIIAQQYDVLIGDAKGIDTSVQRYFSERKYGRVRVYCMNDTCRNNVGDWPVKSIRLESSRRDFSYFTAKDRAMAIDTDYGFMIWSGASKGSLNNMINLLGLKKKVLLYYYPGKVFHSLTTFPELETAVREILDAGDPGITKRMTAFFERRLTEERQQSMPFLN